MADDLVKLLVNGQLYEGWKAVSISRNLTSLSGSFNLSVFDRWRVDQRQWPIVVGDAARVEIGSDPVITGFIDSLEASFDAESRNITILGRDKTGDLVDSSITNEPGEFKGLTLDQLAKEFTKPFGMKVKTEADVGDPFDPWTIKQGETVFESLERAARLRSVLLISDADGNLVITKKANTRASTELVQGVNVLGGSATYDQSNRFSEYIIKGQTAGTDNFYGDQATSALGKAKDEGIKRYRPLIVIAEGSVNQGGSITRAQWEATSRAAQGTKVTIKVQGWRQLDGSLWQINQIVKVRCRFLGLEHDMLISSVTFNQDDSAGTTSDLELMRPDAFEPSPTVKKKNDPASHLGWD